MKKKVKNNKFTTWCGIVEFNMDASNTKKMCCMAKSKEGAIKELDRLAKREKPNAFHINITHVKPEVNDKQK